MSTGKSSKAKKKQVRGYQQTIRADAAGSARTKMLQVTRGARRSAPPQNVGLGQVAASAGVARSTIYPICGSREGLMVAVAEDVLRRGGFDQPGRAFRNPDPRQAMESSMREGARLYSEQHAVSRAIMTLASLDPAIAHAAARFEYGRKGGMAELA